MDVNKINTLIEKYKDKSITNDEALELISCLFESFKEVKTNLGRLV